MYIVYTQIAGFVYNRLVAYSFQNCTKKRSNIIVQYSGFNVFIYPSFWSSFFCCPGRLIKKQYNLSKSELRAQL